MDRIDKIMMVVISICVVVIVVNIGILAYRMINGCPMCGCTEWIATGRVNTVIINHFPHKIEELACANCGHIL